MPMNRDDYPEDWDAIALTIKEAANWHCQECGRPCLKPNQEWADFVLDLLNSGDDLYLQTFEEHYDNETGEWGTIEKPGRFVLTVAHLNHRPMDCRPENLKALCSPCHLRHDGKQMATKKYLKRERLGQLSLF